LTPWRERAQPAIVTWMSPSWGGRNPQTAAAVWLAERAAGGEHGRHFAPVRSGDGPDLVHAAMLPHQPPGRRTVGDRVSTDSSRRELARGDDAVLPSRQAQDRGVADQYFVDAACRRVVASTLVLHGQHFVDGAHRRRAPSTFLLYSQRFVDPAIGQAMETTKCCLRHTRQHPAAAADPLPQCRSSYEPGTDLSQREGRARETPVRRPRRTPRRPWPS